MVDRANIKQRVFCYWISVLGNRTATKERLENHLLLQKVTGVTQREITDCRPREALKRWKLTIVTKRLLITGNMTADNGTDDL